jgi:uncharacterized protein (TIGR02611 family)
MIDTWLKPTLRQARRLVIFVIGATVMLLGVVMMVTPGPAFVVIPIGLAILATEFVWARRLLKRVKREALQLKDRVNGAWQNSGQREPMREGRRAG